MLNFRSKTPIIAAWCTVILAASGVSAALGLRPSLVAFALAVGLTPAVVLQFLGRTPPQTIAEVLRTVETDRTR